MAQRAYKFRVYPNETQVKTLAVYFGHTRYVWNYMLDLRSREYKETKKTHNYVSLGKLVTQMKKEQHDWLKAVPSSAITQKIIDQDKAFQSFYKRVKTKNDGKGYPKFKGKYDKQSFRVTLDQRVIASYYKAGEFVKIPKLGVLKMKWTRIPNGIPKMATVSKNTNGQYFISFSVEEHIEQLPKTKAVVGVDMGMGGDVVCTSDGYKSGTPKFLKQSLNRVQFLNKCISKCKSSSKRKMYLKNKLSNLHNHIVNQRSDFLHKESMRLVREYDIICIEDLSVEGMKGLIKNINRTIGDIGLYELRRQLTYKSEWYGKQLVVIGRYEPSTQLCRVCGSLNKIPLVQRTYSCKCGYSADRDIHAAKNILDMGLKLA